MLTDTSKKYLITGCTDAKGSSQYNMDLSQKRADAVVNALIKKGVPNKMLKAKGVGAKISVSYTHLVWTTLILIESEFYFTTNGRSTSAEKGY